MPDFSLEMKMLAPVAGVDEVGRGPWAGPVLACACIIDPLTFSDALAARLDESKKLTARQRNALFQPLLDCCQVGLGTASVTEIDQHNILEATFLAMRRAVEALPEKPHSLLVDGNRDPGLGIETQTVIKGDSRCFSIAAASVIAKVTRDRLMAKLAKQFPGYGWEKNAGYGTSAHQDGLARLGVTVHHRRRFAPIAKLLDKAD